MRGLLFVILIAVTGLAAQAQLVFGQNRQSSAPIELNYSNPREYEIADIEIRGIEFLDNNALISLSGLKVGDKIKIPGDDISLAIKKLWKQGIIGNIGINAAKIEGNKIWLVIEMSERPRLIRYEFEGVTKTHRTEMEDDIELTRGKILTDVVIKNAELAIRKYYESKGYRNAKIKIRQKRDSVIRNSAVLHIKVDKGHKVRIRNINFEGNEHFTDAKLKSKMKKTGEIASVTLPKKLLTTSIRLLNPVNTYHFLTHKDTSTTDEFMDKLAKSANVNVFKQSKLVEDEYIADKDALIAFLNSKGYRDAEIISDTIYVEDERYLTIDFKVNEGKKYYFRDIHWSGNFVYDDETLDRVLGVEKGDVYDLELINKKLNFDPTGIDISSLYMDDGYLFFNINPVEIGIKEDSIDLEMRIHEGSQATINKVTISGNEKTNDHVVMRELRTLPGDKFSRAELIRTQRELSQLGYFNPQKVNPVPIPNPMTETVDIEWQLEEQPSDQIELSGGWGGFYGFIGTLGVSFNNFSIKEVFNSFPPMGDGQKLSLRMQANGRQFQSYSLSFTEPWLGGRKPNSFGISLNRSISRNASGFDRRGRPNYNGPNAGSLSVTGATVSLGRRVNWPDDFFIISNSISYSRYNLENWGFFNLGFSDGPANSIVFNTTIARRSSDNPMYPTRGSDVSLSINLTPPFSLFRDFDYNGAPTDREDEDYFDDLEAWRAEMYKWVEYHKWNLDLRYYLPVGGEKLVLAPRIHFGFIGTYSNRAPVGPFERFVLGGDGLTGQNFILGTDVVGLRGYPNPQQSSRGPSSLTPYDYENGIYGGTAFTKYVLELRYPVSLQPTATIYVLGFLEGGNSWVDMTRFNPYSLNRAAGFGVRIFMPAFGLLGLDFGYGFDPVPGFSGPSGTQFHFSIGQQIR